MHVTRSSTGKTAWATVALVFVGAVAALFWRHESNFLKLHAQQAGGPPTAAQLDPNSPLFHALSLSQAFREAAEKALPTVVTITSVVEPRQASAEEREEMPEGENPFEGTPLEEFFRDFQEHGGEMPPQGGVGSGVIVDPSGLILTNNHVVAGADRIVVRLADGREYEGIDVRTDPETDLAVVRIAGAGELPAAQLGDSDQLRIGDWVIAVGNPFELEQTVSAGIISGQGRSLSSARRTIFLQTDAAINPGNSGGPLMNLLGEVVGINTAIATNSGSFQGVGFAIPINHAKWVLEQLVNSGRVQRGYLGVAIEGVNAELAARLGVAINGGVYVARVFPETPAAAAGLQDGDLVLTFDGKEVHSPRELQELVERTPLGEERQIVVRRGEETLTLPITIEALPEDFAAAPQMEEEPQPDREEGDRGDDEGRDGEGRNEERGDDERGDRERGDGENRDGENRDGENRDGENRDGDERERREEGREGENRERDEDAERDSREDDASAGEGVFQSDDLGLTVRNLSVVQAEERDLTVDAGVLVTRVTRRSRAAEAGLEDGLVICRVGRRDVRNVEEFSAALAEESLEEGIVIGVIDGQRERLLLLQQ